MAKLTKKMEQALNDQMQAEMFSQYLYLSMSAYFESQDLSGFANWMRVQSDEEGVHVHKLFDYIVERGGRVSLQAIEAPQAEWDGPLQVFEGALEHERMISSRIDSLADLACEKGDRASESFLRWYVDEQVEEEASVDKVVKMLRISEGQPVALLMLDRELATRVLPPPPAAGA